MIYLLTFFCSLMINFGAVTVTPFNMSSLNNNGVGQQYIDELRSRIATNFQGYYASTYGWISDVPDESIIVTYGDTLWGSYQSIYKVLVPLESYNHNSSSVTCNNYTYSDGVVDSVTISFNNYVEFWIGGNNYVNNPYVNGYRNYTFGSSDNYRLVYCKIPIYCSETLVVDSVYMPSIEGHTQNGVNDFQDVSLPFGSVSVSGHSSVTTVDDSNTNNLLGNILNSLHHGFNRLVDGLNNLGYYTGRLWGNINSTINYIIEPIDPDEFGDLVGHSSLSPVFEELKNIQHSIEGIVQDDDVVFVFTVPNFLGGDSYSFRISDYLDQSKSSWQPLLLTFLYASVVWGFYRGFASLVAGLSPAANDVKGAVRS